MSKFISVDFRVKFQPTLTSNGVFPVFGYYLLDTTHRQLLEKVGGTVSVRFYDHDVWSSNDFLGYDDFTWGGDKWKDEFDSFKFEPDLNVGELRRGENSGGRVHLYGKVRLTAGNGEVIIGDKDTASRIYVNVP